MKLSFERSRTCCCGGRFVTTRHSAPHGLLKPDMDTVTNNVRVGSISRPPNWTLRAGKGNPR